MGEAGRRGRGLRAVVAVAVGARAVFLALHQASPLAGFYRIDTLYYRSWALDLLGGGGAAGGVFEQGPLYAYLLAGVFALFGPRELPALILQAACGVATSALVFDCARRVFGSRAGIAAGLLAALYGPFLLHEGMLMKSFLEPLLVVLALWAGLRHGERGRARWAALAGAAVGAAVLVREVHALLLPPLLLWAALPGEPRRPARLRLAGIAALVAAFAATVAPAALRNLRVDGEFAVATAAGGENLYLAFGPEATGYYDFPEFVRPRPHLEHEDFRHEMWLRTGRAPSRAESSRYWTRQALETAAADPARAARLVALRAALLLNDFEIPDNEFYRVAREMLPPLRALPTFGWLLGLGLLGIWALRRETGPRLLPLGLLAALAAGLLLTFVLARYRLAFVAVWIVLAGGGLSYLADLARRGHRTGFAAALLFAAAASAPAWPDPPLLDPQRRAGYEQGYREEVAVAARFNALLPEIAARAAAAAPSDPGPFFALAEACAATGRVPEEISALRRALAADPGHLPSRWRLARVSSDRGLPGEALQLLEEMVVQAPHLADVRFALGSVLLQKALDAGEEERPGLVARAAARLAESVALDPGSADARVQLARLRLIRGERGEALGQLRAALDASPGHPEAARILWLLERGLVAPGDGA